jgi:hypothetical protein
MPQGLAGSASNQMMAGFKDYFTKPGVAEAAQAATQASTPSTTQEPKSGLSQLADNPIVKAAAGPAINAMTGGGGQQQPAAPRPPAPRPQAAPQQGGAAGGGGPMTPAVTQVPQARLRPQLQQNPPMQQAGPPAPAPATGMGGDQATMYRLLQMLGGRGMNPTQMAGGY